MARARHSVLLLAGLGHSIVCAQPQSTNIPVSGQQYVAGQFTAPDPRCGDPSGSCDDDNGITVEDPKVYDNRTLQLQLMSLSSRLAQLSGIDQNSLITRIGALQGASSSQIAGSFQVTGMGLPGVQTTSTTGTPSIATTIGSGIAPSAPTTYSNSIVTTQPSNTVQTVNTAGAVNPNIPSLESGTGMAAPTAFNVSSLDALNEQMQLSYQIMSLQLLLQGSLGDDYSYSGLGKRHVTFGFPISIASKEKYRGDVAEVEVSVCNPAMRLDDTPPTLQNILPEEKTYNVASLTNHSASLGIGAVIGGVVNVGGNFLWSHQTYYLVRDQDTVALHRTRGDTRSETCPIANIPLPVPADAHTQSITSGPTPAAGGGSQSTTPTPPITFAWQFRPVLGRKAVSEGLRPTFAQVSLAPSIAGESASRDFRAVLITTQTCWRKYDSSRGIVGERIRGSCSQLTPRYIPFLFNTTRILDVTTRDNGDGTLSVRIYGSFPYGTQVASGETYIQNVDQVTDQDSSYLRFSASAQAIAAHDLRIVGPDGTQQIVEVDDDHQCFPGIENGSASVVNYSDTLSKISVDLNGCPWHAANIGLRSAIVAEVAGKAYGFSDQPFLPGGVERLEFLAPTSSLQGQQTLTIKRLFSKVRPAVYTINLSAMNIQSVSVFNSDKTATSYVVTGTQLYGLTIAEPLAICAGKSSRQCIRIVNPEGTLAMFTVPASVHAEKILLRNSSGSTFIEALPKAGDGDAATGDDTAKVSFDKISVAVGSVSSFTLTGKNLQMVSEIDFLGKAIPFAVSSGTGAKSISLAPPAGMTLASGTVALKIVFQDGSAETLNVSVV
jgi:hypothetical protein